MKKTIHMTLDAEPIISAIMAKMGFQESERVVGIDPNNVFATIAITYEGLGINYREDRYFVEMPAPGYGTSPKFISLKYPHGLRESSVEAFKQRHKPTPIEIKSFE